MCRLYTLFLITGLIYGQSIPIWTQKTLNSTWGAPLGWIQAVQDPISNQAFLYIEPTTISGVASVTNGSPTVNWVSGAQYGNFQAGDVLSTLGSMTSVTVSAVASATQFTITANYTGGTSGSATWLANETGIFSKAGMFYSASTNNMKIGWATNSIGDFCSADTASVPGESHRQPDVIDTKRNLLWLGGGVVVQCGNTTVNTSGTAVTRTGTGASNAQFPADGTINGKTVTINSATYTVATVSDINHLTLTTSAGTQSGVNMSMVTGSSANPRNDWYYVPLQADPTTDVPVEVFPAHFPGGAYDYGHSVYDSANDVFFLFSADGGAESHTNWVYCSTRAITTPYAPSGVLTTAQKNAGCGKLSNDAGGVDFSNGPDDWSIVCPGSHRDTNSSCAGALTQPGGVFHGGLIYDPTTQLSYFWGGIDGASSTCFNQTWNYNTETQTWTQMSFGGSVPGLIKNTLCGTNTLPTPSWSLVPGTSKIYLHQGTDFQGTQPSDWVLDTQAGTWTLLQTGVGPTEESLMTFDPVKNTLITYGNLSGNTDMWQAQLEGIGISVPITIQELLPIGQVGCTSAGSCGIARTNEPFRVGIPLPDNDVTGTTTTAVLGLTSCSAGQFRSLTSWPSGRIQWLEVAGIVPSLSAGGTTVCTLVGNSSGNFGGANLASGTSTITVATGAMTATIKAAGNFNLIDTLSVGGTTLVTTSSSASRGLIVTGPANPNTTCGTCATVFSSANDSSSVSTIEENGPVEAVIKTTGALKDGGGNIYLRYTVRQHFYAGKTSMKVHRELRNADNPSGGSFATAYKGFASDEVALDLSTTGTNSYTFGGKTTPVTGTFSGSEDATMVQLYSDWMQDRGYGDPGEWDTSAIPQNSTQSLIPRSSGGGCSDFYCYPDNTRVNEGYTVKDGSTVLETGTRADATAGWGNVENGSGVGVLTGVWYLSAYWPKSIEFNAGGNNTVIGVWPKQISGFNWWICYTCYQINDLFYNFHATSLASNDTDFKKLQYDLTGRAPIAQYNTSNVLLIGPIPDSTSEDNYYLAAGAAANPVVTSGKMCCVDDSISASGHTNPGGPYVLRTWAWGATGGINESEISYNYWVNFLTRGTTTRYLFAKMRNRFLEEQALPRSDFSGGWSGTAGYPSVLNATGFPVPGSANASNALQSWSLNEGGFEQHSHIYGLPYAYYSTGEEHYSGSVKQGWYDWVLNNSPENGNVADLQYPSVPRAIGPKLVFAAVVHDFAVGIGDSTTATGAYITAEAVMDKSVRPVLVAPKTACTNTGNCRGAGDYGTDRNRGEISAMALGNLWDLPQTETYGTGDGTTVTFNHTASAPRLPLLCGPQNATYFSEYWPTIAITAGSVTAVDPVSCNGTVSGTGIVSGTVNYSTGAMSVTFTTPPANGQSITVRFYYPTAFTVGSSVGGTRGAGAFQTSLAAFGVYTYAKSRGAAWSGYEDAMDLALGMDQWAKNEITITDNTGSWTHVGLAFGESIDFCNDPRPGGTCLADPSGHQSWYAPTLGNTPGVSTVWWDWLPAIDYVGDTSWRKTFEANMFHELSSVSFAPNGWTEYATWGMSALVYRALNPPNYVLSDMAITSFVDNGGGNYTVQWTVPTTLITPPGSSNPYKFKWGTKSIVDFNGLGYDPLETATYAIDPTTHQTWFSATNVNNEPTPATGGTTQSYQFVTSTTGLVQADFSVKAFLPASCSISPTTLGPWTIGQVISITLTTSGCSSSTWSNSGSFPTGISLNSSNGLLSGTISGSTGTFTPHAIYDTANNAYSILVNAAPSITTSSPLPAGTVGTAYSQTLAASGGTAPLTWSVSSGTVPTGTTLSSGGVLSGTPTTTTGSPFTFTALVTDANSVTGSKSFTVTINSAPSTNASKVIGGKVSVGGVVK